jgi:predicted RNA-binding protein YlxR (DUF448 family)
VEAQDATVSAAVDATAGRPGSEATSRPAGSRSTKSAGAPAKSKRKGPRPKHVPQRMCVSCRERDSKRTLTRIVRTPDGEVAIDPSGRQSGRGSYLCDNPGCWEKAIRGGLLTRALNISLPAEAIETLRQRAASLRAAQEADRPAAAESARPRPTTAGS